MKEFPPFRLDNVNQCLWRRTNNGNDERILLKPKAFAVLRHLVEHRTAGDSRGTSRRSPAGRSGAAGPDSCALLCQAPVAKMESSGYGGVPKCIRGASQLRRAPLASSLSGRLWLHKLDLYREAHRSLIESRVTLVETAEEDPYLATVSYLTGQCIVLPMNLVFLGEWGEALGGIKDAIAVMDKNADHYWGQAMRLYRAWVHLHAMDFAGALAICDSALPLVRDPIQLRVHITSGCACS